MSEKPLSQARRRYLRTIQELDPEGKGLRSICLAKHLQISRPSVHAMLEKLEEQGYIEKEFYGIIYLTEKGKQYNSFQH